MMLLLLPFVMSLIQTQNPARGEKAVALVERDMADLGVKGPFKVAALLNEDSSFLGTDRWEMTIVAANGDQYYVFVSGGTPLVISRGSETYDQSDLPNNDLLPADSPLFTNEADFLLSVLSKRSETGHATLTIYGNTGQFGVPRLKNGYPFAGVPCDCWVTFRADLNLVTKISQTPVPPVNTATPTLTSSQASSAAETALKGHIVPESQNGWYPFQKAELMGPPSLAYFRDYKDPIARLAWINPFRVTYGERKPPQGRRIYSTGGPPNMPTVDSFAVDATTGQYLGRTRTGFASFGTSSAPIKAGKYSVVDQTIRSGAPPTRNTPNTDTGQQRVQVKANPVVGEDYVRIALRTMQKLYGGASNLHLTGVYETTQWGGRVPTWYASFEDDDSTWYTVLVDGQAQSVTYMDTFAPPGPSDLRAATADDVRFAKEVYSRLGTSDEVELIQPLSIDSDRHIDAFATLKHHGLPFFNPEISADVSFASGSHRVSLYTASPLPEVNATSPAITAETANAKLLEYALHAPSDDYVAAELNDSRIQATLTPVLGYFSFKSEPKARLVYAGEVRLPTKDGGSITEHLSKFVDAMTGDLLAGDN